MLFITVSRQTGSLGKEITELLAQKLDLPIINRDLVMSQWFPEILINMSCICCPKAGFLNHQPAKHQFHRIPGK